MLRFRGIIISWECRCVVGYKYGRINLQVRGLSIVILYWPVLGYVHRSIFL